MSQFRGLFGLQSFDDLLGKLRHDLQRLEESPTDEYVAFDFFVTGFHLLDWRYPGDDNRKTRKDIIKDRVLSQVCQDIANGAKHFEATHKENKSVESAEVVEGFVQSNFVQRSAVQVDDLQLRLQGEAAQELGEYIGCLDLAHKVLHFWENYNQLPA